MKDRKSLSKTLILLRVVVIAATLIFTCITAYYMLGKRGTLDIYIPESSCAEDYMPTNDLVEIRASESSERILVVYNEKEKGSRVDIVRKDNESILLASLIVFPGDIICNLSNADFSNCREISAAFLIYLTVLLVSCIISFLMRCRYDQFSYSTLYYCGMSLFMLHLYVNMFTRIIRLVTDPAKFDMLNVFGSMKSAGEAFLYITIPIVLIFALCLCISNISLIRHEGKRLVNILGLILSGLLVFGYVFFLVIASFLNHGSVNEMKVYGAILSIFSTTIVYFETMLASAIICGFIAAKRRPAYDKTHVIILGCAISNDGTPLPLLRGRIDRAIAFAKEQKVKTGRDMVFVPSGGKGSDEVISESESMANYLVSQGISRDNIILEDKSVNTVQNMQFSLEKINEQCAEQGTEPNLIFSTSEYHVLRSGMISRSAGLDAEGIGSRTKWYFWPNAFVREFIGLLASKWKRHALLVTICIAVFAAINIIFPM